MGRVKGILIQELKRFIPPWRYGRPSRPILHAIVRHRRERWYARLHHGAHKKPYADQLSLMQTIIEPEEYPELNVQVYTVWRAGCRFTGLRPDWMRVCPDIERSLHNNFAQHCDQNEFKRMWKERVAGVREYRKTQRANTHLWGVMLRKTRIHTMWQNNGGHLHRMPTHNKFREILITQSSAYVVRFLVLLMQVKQVRMLMYSGVGVTLDVLEHDYPEEAERARQSCVEYVEPVLTGEPLIMFGSWDWLRQLDVDGDRVE